MIPFLFSVLYNANSHIRPTTYIISTWHIFEFPLIEASGKNLTVNGRSLKVHRYIKSVNKRAI